MLRLKPCFALSLSVFSLSIASTSATADVQIRFVESAPKDAFIIRNIGRCSLEQLAIGLDLSTSDGKLIFDTTETGAGVEVFQPFEVQTGEFVLADGQQRIQDGSNSLSLEIEQLMPNQSVSFTIDVDDNLTQSQLGQIRVTGSEINGAKASLNLGTTDTLIGVFDSNNLSVINIPNSACMS